MTAYVALVRALNVGGSGLLSMATLKATCIEAGFGQVRTYIASGNALFTSRLGEPRVRTALARGLEAHLGKPVTVVVRTATEIDAVLRANPFCTEPGRSTVAIFLNGAPPADTLLRASGRVTERVALGRREIYVAYGERMVGSKLRFPGLEPGTARNMNTLARLARLAFELGPP